jgi:hypothetical protein
MAAARKTQSVSKTNGPQPAEQAPGRANISRRKRPALLALAVILLTAWLIFLAAMAF